MVYSSLVAQIARHNDGKTEDMFLLIVAVVIAVAGIIAMFVKIPHTSYAEDRFGRRTGEASVSYTRLTLAGVGLLLVALLLLFLSCFTTVGAKNTGVVTTFGAVSDRELDAGPALKAPWQKVTDIDGTIQTDEYQGDNSLLVRLGDGQSARVYVTNRWRIVPEMAPAIYQDYRSDDPTESFRDAVVSTQFKAAVNDALGDYNPTSSIDSVDATDTKAISRLAEQADFTPDYDELSQQVEDKLVEKTKKDDEPLIEIVDVTISFIDFGEKTDEKINLFLSEVAKTRQALQAQATNAAQSAANEELTESLTDEILTARCLDLIADGWNPPIGFSCFPGAGNGAGGVIVNGTK